MVEQEKIDAQIRWAEKTKISIIENRGRHHAKLLQKANHKSNQNAVIEKAQEKAQVFKDKLYIDKHQSIMRVQDMYNQREQNLKRAKGEFIIDRTAARYDIFTENKRNHDHIKKFSGVARQNRLNLFQDRKIQTQDNYLENLTVEQNNIDSIQKKLGKLKMTELEAVTELKRKARDHLNMVKSLEKLMKDQTIMPAGIDSMGSTLSSTVNINNPVHKKISNSMDYENYRNLPNGSKNSSLNNSMIKLENYKTSVSGFGHNFKRNRFNGTNTLSFTKQDSHDLVKKRSYDILGSIKKQATVELYTKFKSPYDF